MGWTMWPTFVQNICTGTTAASLYDSRRCHAQFNIDNGCFRRVSCLAGLDGDHDRHARLTVHMRGEKIHTGRWLGWVRIQLASVQ
jgi:hypothetical protein